jgi:hypothetical protein
VQATGASPQRQSIAAARHREAVAAPGLARPQLTGARMLVAFAVALCTAVDARAQQLVVTVRDSLARTPVAAAIVTATDLANGTRVFALTSDSGSAVLRLPNAGEWSTAVRRIGIVPRATPAIRVDAGESVAVVLSVANLRFTLPGVRVTATAGVCGRAPSGGDRAATLWEQVTLALRSSALTRGDSIRGPRLRVTLFERYLSTDLALRSSRVIREGGGGARPFFAADPDSLARFGYVRADPDGMISYFAPDETVLLSDAFVRTHCFRTPDVDANPALAELEFHPVPRRSVADVAGVAYVDTASGELRRIVFRYVNTGVLIPRSATNAGGEVSLRRLGNGQWIVSDWAIRMPQVIGRSWADVRTVTGYRETGGATVPASDERPGDVAGNAPVTSQDTLPMLGDTDQPRRIATSRDTSIRAVIASAALQNRPLRFVAARTVEARSRFAQHRKERQGIFFDSAAIAVRGATSVFDLVSGAPGVSSFHVPDDQPGPPNVSDRFLAAEWRPGAELPMMTIPTAAPEAAVTRLCYPKIFLDARSAPLAVGELRQLRAVQIATMEIYPPNSRAAMTSRITESVTFDGNRCGLIQLWSYVDYEAKSR